MSRREIRAQRRQKQERFDPKKQSREPNAAMHEAFDQIERERAQQAARGMQR